MKNSANHVVLAIMFGAFFMPVYPAVAAEPSSEWGLCKSADECVIVGAGCAIHAVNKSFEAEADQYYRSMNARMDCSVGADPRTTGATLVCQSHKTSCKDALGRDDPASTCATKPQCTIVLPVKKSP